MHKHTIVVIVPIDYCYRRDSSEVRRHGQLSDAFCFFTRCSFNIIQPKQFESGFWGGTRAVQRIVTTMSCHFSAPSLRRHSNVMHT
jgi:hypothetical protein